MPTNTVQEGILDSKEKERTTESARPNTELWEILVPTVRNDGKPYRTRYHRVWDKKVDEISGGLTIMKPARGRWVHQGRTYEERMIPVRIYCTEQQISDIIDFTIKYYDQIAVFAHRVSDKVILRHRDEKRK